MKKLAALLLATLLPLLLASCAATPEPAPHKTASDAQFAEDFRDAVTAAGLLVTDKMYDDAKMAQGGRGICGVASKFLDEATKSGEGSRRNQMEYAMGMTIGVTASIDNIGEDLARVIVPVALADLCPWVFGTERP